MLKLLERFFIIAAGCSLSLLLFYLGWRNTIEQRLEERIQEQTVVERVVEVPVVEATTTEQIRTKMNALIEKHDVLHPRKIDFIGVYNLSSGKKIISYYFEDEEATEIEYEVKE